MKQKEPVLKSLDAYFILDERLLSHLTGEAGATFLRQRWFRQCLPEEGTHLEIGVAMENSRHLLASPIFKWSCSSVQNELRAAQGMLQSVVLGHPCAMGTENTPWAVSVHSALPLFITWAPDAAAASAASSSREAGSATSSLQGADALQKLWEIVSKKPEPSMEDVKIFGSFRELLEPNQLKKLDAIVKGLFNTSSMKRKEAPSSSDKPLTTAKKLKKKKEIVSTESRISDVAEALLYG